MQYLALSLVLVLSGPTPSESLPPSTLEGLRASEYHYGPTAAERVFSAPNRAHGLRSRVGPDGLDVFPRTVAADGAGAPWRLTIRTSGLRRGPVEQPLGRARVSVSKGRATLDHGRLVEWFENGHGGIEQGWELARPPAGPALEPVLIDLVFAGDLALALHADGLGGDLADAQGRLTLRYAGLRAWDARGVDLPARLVATSRGVAVRVDDAGAAYPITVDPTLTNPLWLAPAVPQESANFGASVSTAGDVNGDGYSDVIVGAPGYDSGEPDEGVVFVFLGSPGGLVTPAAWTAESNQGFSGFGQSAALAGDVNGDGYSDVIVGAHAYDGGQTDEGRAFVYLGSAAGLASTPSWTAESDQASSRFGYAVTTAGDVNGDGFSDVIVGAYLYDGGQTDEGRVFLYHGSAAGLGATPAWTDEADQAGAQLGFSLSSAGDVDGDGFLDVVAGAPFHDGGATDGGAAFCWLGSASGLAPDPHWSRTFGQANGRYGIAVSTAGDLNGDGYSDVLVGADLFDNGQVDEGAAYAYHGSAGGLLTTTAWVHEGNQTSAIFGHAVSTAGDVDGDGFDDVLIGAHLFDAGQANEGRAFLFRGSSGGLGGTASWSGEGEQALARYGVSVSVAGDVNGDGYSDVIVGASTFDELYGDDGRAFVHHGAAGVTKTGASITASSGQASTQLGRAVASAGDVNGDGYSDWVVGVPRYNFLQGRVFVYHGGAPSSTPQWGSSPGQWGGEFASAVAGAGDVNGDGYHDVLVGAPRMDVGLTDNGCAKVFYGSSGGVTSPQAWSTAGPIAGAQLGRSVASAGDVNGDGFSDVVVGMLGAAAVHHGSPTGLSSSPDRLIAEPVLGFGDSVSGAGDVNGDGYSDVVVGAPGGNRVFVYHGSAQGIPGAPSWQVVGTGSFGRAVSSAGDVNGDGFSDVIVGAPGARSASVFLGSPTGLSGAAAWTGLGAGISASRYGASVACAGDVNGDGFSDVVVGDPSDPLSFNSVPGWAYVYAGSSTGPTQAPVASLTRSTGFWTNEFGASVAGAGDLDGDGYAEVVVGAPGEGLGGIASAYYGNGGVGGPVGLDTATQRTADGSRPIGPLGCAGFAGDFTLAGRFAGLAGASWAFPGARRVWLEWEVRPLGAPFDDAGVQRSAELAGVGGAFAFDQPVTGVATPPGGLPAAVAESYRWRLRFVTNDPLRPTGPWHTSPDSALQEASLRRRGAQLP